MQQRRLARSPLHARLGAPAVLEQEDAFLPVVAHHEHGMALPGAPRSCRRRVRLRQVALPDLLVIPLWEAAERMWESRIGIRGLSDNTCQYLTRHKLACAVHTKLWVQTHPLAANPSITHWHSLERTHDGAALAQGGHEAVQVLRHLAVHKLPSVVLGGLIRLCKCMRRSLGGGTTGAQAQHGTTQCKAELLDRQVGYGSPNFMPAYLAAAALQQGAPGRATASPAPPQTGTPPCSTRAARCHCPAAGRCLPGRRPSAHGRCSTGTGGCDGWGARRARPGQLQRLSAHLQSAEPFCVTVDDADFALPRLAAANHPHPTSPFTWPQSCAAHH